ncbi:hypothetical protein BUALT_Bualt03G0057900 [Buddleja alternifolia]|uniref:Pentatricopeptide repeat-containing protein n=1 Tax=Buddleja alternifolia TaxID=168488 RepID=A0AAV6Y2M8_9LAMI|nr:hypothetical protein BUALT_Bualt03G0057900 [Buddleja alternifolia]
MLPNIHSLEALIRRCLISSRWYSTRGKRRNQTSLYGIISPLGNPNVNVTPELQQWVESGNKVSEWMKSRGTYTLTPVQHAVQLDLIGKVHGYVSAESYFNSLTEQDKTEKAYGALLHCYVRQRLTDKALAHLKQMKEKGLTLSSLTFNDIMCLYSNTGENDKVPDVFNQMKENHVQPDNLSYRICINSYGVRSDIEGLEKILKEMENDAHIVMDWNTYAVVANFYIKADIKCKANIALKKAEERLDDKDSLGYNHLISLHARLGNRDDVFRLWSLEKNACKRCLNRDYITIMESLVRLGELEEAGKVLKEWDASGNCYDFRVPSVVIVGYIEKGLCEKAEALIERHVEMGTSNVWGRLSAGYLEKGEMGKALESIKVIIRFRNVTKDIKLDDKVITKILRLVGEKGGSDDAEKVVNLLRSAIPLKRQMYHTLLKSCIASGKEVGAFLDMMKADNYEEDKETLEILSIKQDNVESE